MHQSVNGKPGLSEQASRYYHQALLTIKALNSDIQSDSVLYLHFLLLTYDISYAARYQTSSSALASMNMIGQHLQILMQIMRVRVAATKTLFTTSVMRHVVHLHAQLCLTGCDFEALSKVYIEQSMLLSSSRPARSLGGDPLRTCPNRGSESYNDVFLFGDQMDIRYTMLSRLALRVRANTRSRNIEGRPTSPDNFEEAKSWIEDFSVELQDFWDGHYPGLIERCATHAGPCLARLAWVMMQAVRPSLPLTSHIPSCPNEPKR